MDNIKLYNIEPTYINALLPFAPHLFHNKEATQTNARKYIGVIIHIHGFDYFAPLSSFKEKHLHMQDTTDFIKIKKYAVINLNNMFPVPLSFCTYVDISKEHNPKYRQLLLAEYRFIRSIQNKIRKNAQVVYQLKTSGNETALTKRCNDFLKLEELCLTFANVLPRSD